MRYKLSIDRTVNRLVPHYLSGRRFILFVQSCLYPLQCTNERFRDFTKEMHIRARMTSQVIYFEWFLNYKFGKYIRDGKDRILIRDSESVGVDLYHEGAEYQRPCTIWYNGEQIISDNDAERPRPFYLLIEEKPYQQGQLCGLCPARHHITARAGLHALLCGEYLQDGWQDLSDQD